MTGTGATPHTAGAPVLLITSPGREKAAGTSEARSRRPSPLRSSRRRESGRRDAQVHCADPRAALAPRPGTAAGGGAAFRHADRRVSAVVSVRPPQRPTDGGGAAPPRRSQSERAGKSFCGRWPRPTGRAAPVVGRDNGTPAARLATRDCRGWKRKDFPAREAAPGGGGRRPAGRPKGAQRPPEPRLRGVRASSRGVQPRQPWKSSRPAPAGVAAGSVLAIRDFHPLLNGQPPERVSERVIHSLRHTLTSWSARP